ncbi:MULTISPECIES: nitric oxide-sensing protein NosP [Pseudomonas]|nr:nitric oxide-sensing protein NosP [Halopseudomonas gallaeciensis]MAG65305.1 GfdT protein [Pseudomonadales bacterium]
MTEALDPDAAAQDLARQLLHPHLGCVLFFCSAEYPLERLATALEQHFGGVMLLGCTTAGEISAQGYGRGCISALGLDLRTFAVDCTLIQALDSFSLVEAQQAVERMLGYCRQVNLAPIKEHTFALTMLDGLSSREELVLNTLSAALGSIPHFGGSAGDDNHLSHTHVYYQGRFLTGAAVVVMINTWLDFEVFTTHHLKPTDSKLVVTAADSASRTVLELNAEPAAEEYARLVGVPLDALRAEHFALNALAVRIRDQFYVRSIQRVNADRSLTFYCAVDTGIVLTAMTPGELLPNLRLQFEQLRQRLGEPVLILGCDCFLRRMEAELRGENQRMSDFLAANRVIGFNTYGEQFNGMHINQTFTGVAFAFPR